GVITAVSFLVWFIGSYLVCFIGSSVLPDIRATSSPGICGVGVVSVTLGNPGTAPTLGITRPARHRPSGHKPSRPPMPQGLPAGPQRPTGPARREARQSQDPAPRAEGHPGPPAGGPVRRRERRTPPRGGGPGSQARASLSWANARRLLTRADRWPERSRRCWRLLVCWCLGSRPSHVSR